MAEDYEPVIIIDKNQDGQEESNAEGSRLIDSDSDGEVGLKKPGRSH